MFQQRASCYVAALGYCPKEGKESVIWRLEQTLAVLAEGGEAPPCAVSEKGHATVTATATVTAAATVTANAATVTANAAARQLSYDTTQDSTVAPICQLTNPPPLHRSRLSTRPLRRCWRGMAMVWRSS